MKEKIPEQKKTIEKSILEKAIMKKGSMREKELQELKFNSLKLSIFVGLFFWLLIGVLIKNILLGAGIACIIITISFIILIQIPLAKKKKYTTKVEADLPIFLMRLATELRIGKNLSKAINDSCKEESYASVIKRIIDRERGIKK